MKTNKILAILIFAVLLLLGDGDGLIVCTMCAVIPLWCCKEDMLKGVGDELSQMWK